MLNICQKRTLENFESSFTQKWILCLIVLVQLDLLDKEIMSENQDSESLERVSAATTPTSSYHSREEDQKTRLDTFRRYPVPHNVNVLELAANGFMYNASSSNKQEVFCVGCGSTVHHWNIGEDPGDQKFHGNGCRFVKSERPQTESKNGSSLVRATSEQNNEENTKPFQALPASSNLTLTNTTQMMETQSLVTVNPKPLHPRVLQQSHSLPGTRTLDLTQLHKRERGHQSTFSLSHVHQETTSTPFQSGQSSLSSQSGISLHSSSHFQPVSFHRQSPISSLASGNFPSIQPNQLMTRNFQRLENPDPVQEFIDQLDMRNGQDRLHTFNQYWSSTIEFRNVRLLVMCGFYCIGQDDAVECFCCHVICANWSRNDNPRQRHLEMSPRCRFIRGEECGDIPLMVEPQRRPRTPYQSFPPSIPSSSTQISRNPSPAPSLTHHPTLSPQVPHNISPSPSLSNVQPSTSHPRRSLSNVQPSENISPLPTPNQPTPVSIPSPGASTNGASIDYQNPSPSLIERSNRMLEFPCANPANPTMREEHARLQTFVNSNFRRHTNLQASNETLARAGLYYLGDGDRTKCWFCDGGLKDFEVNDDPWLEHAKYYPECEFLLQQKGPGYVTGISAQHPNVQRPILPARSGRVLPQVVSSPHPLPPPPDRIEDPQQLLHNRERMIEQAMNSEPVATARAMGFTDERIREVQMRKVVRSNNVYQTNESLIDALLAPNEEAEAAADAEHQGGLPMDEGNVIDMSNGTIHIRGGNFIGPSVINGRIYNPQGQNPQGDEMFTYENSRPRGSNIIINGRPMEQFMNEVFESAFSSNPPYIHRRPIHHFNNQGMTISTRTVQRAPASAPPQIHVPRNTSSNIHTLSSPSAPAPTPMPRPQTQPTPPPASGTPEERLEQIERERRCKVCLTEEADILFQPCGHICACTGCSQRVNVCPVCRRRIVRYIRTYHA